MELGVWLGGTAVAFIQEVIGYIHSTTKVPKGADTIHTQFL